ncbi:hypothetical protein THIOKS1700005 [Thiocapsa sp. KS1]|nr:hypothetical protein THIOKS1700005 [Thiocapsa sp. KS1]
MRVKADGLYGISCPSRPAFQIFKDAIGFMIDNSSFIYFFFALSVSAWNPNHPPLE